MPVTYAVSYATSPNGPWSASVSVTGTSYTIGELVPGSYYALITAEDAVLGIISSPTIIGPFTVAQTGTEDAFSSAWGASYTASAATGREFSSGMSAAFD